MKTCELSKIFNVQYGNSLELVYLEDDANGVNFVSRTAKQNGVSAKVKKLIDLEPFPKGLITVAVGGSVLETFLQMNPFYTGFHVMVLTPLVEMSVSVKLFYCQCIRANQYKYSYGRQANTTLPNLRVPVLAEIPPYVHSFSIKKYGIDLLGKVDFQRDLKDYKYSSKLVPLSSLFEPKNGLASFNVIRSEIKKGDNWIPYIRPSYRQQTSIDAYVNKTLIPHKFIFPKNTLYVSTDGQGSHTYSYVSTFTFVPNSNVTILIPKRDMSLEEKLYYSVCITKNRYKFSYGRKPKGTRLDTIMIPEYPTREVMEYDLDRMTKQFESTLDIL